MKKYFLSVIVLIISFLLINTSFAYNLTAKDKILVDNLTTKVEKIIEKRGEKVRINLINSIKNLAIKHKKQPKLEIILLEVVKNLNKNENLSKYPYQNNNKSYFEIKELNLKFPVNFEIVSDIKYEIKNEDGNKYVVFSSKNLEGELGNCITEVNLIKITGKPSDNPDFDRYSKDSFLQFDGFFTMISGPQDTCYNDEKIIKIESEFVESIIIGLNNISLISK